jgi:hypothetical protein
VQLLCHPACGSSCGKPPWFQQQEFPAR